MDKPKHNDHPAETEREPYEAPEVRTLADVEDATMSSQESGNDAMSQVSVS
jgi:hypothetical protein